MEDKQNQHRYSFLDISQDTNNLIRFPTNILQQGVIVAGAPAGK